MSDTPKTDAEYQRLGARHGRVRVSFARELERDANTRRDRLAVWARRAREALAETKGVRDPIACRLWNQLEALVDEITRPPDGTACARCGETWRRVRSSGLCVHCVEDAPARAEGEEG